MMPRISCNICSKTTGHVPEIDSAAGTLAGLLCIGGIGGLSSQSTARLGAASGQAGVALGVASTL